MSRRPALIVGAAGQLGGALARRVEGEAVGTSFRAPAAGAIPFDLGAAAATPALARDLLARVRPAVVFLTAGFTWVDGCEQDPRRAFADNRDGPRAVAAAARAVGAQTVYYSTEYVFDGAAGPYDEVSPPRPLNVYGQSKLEGEQAVLEADPRALVLRTTVVYGPEAHGKNFAYQLARELSAGRRLRTARDQVSTPTYNVDLAEASLGLVAAGATGVFNVVGAERLDRAAFARRLARAAGLDADLIEPMETRALGQAAPRPLQAGLSIARLREVLPDWTPRTVEEAVAHWLAHPCGRPWPRA